MSSAKQGRERYLGAALIAVAALLLWAVPSAFAADSIFWGNLTGNKISFANLDGSGGADLTTIGATVNGPVGVAFDTAAGRVYWSNLDADKISFAKLDGSGGGDLNTTGATVSSPSGVAIDPAAGRIYWSNFGGAKISFARLDGSGGGDLTTTGATVSGPFGVAIDPAAGRIYWANSTPSKVSFANLDGSGGGDLDTTGATADHPVGVAVDPAAGRIYWANSTSNSISYANTDGSGGGGDLSTTGTTVNFPQGVALDPGAGGIYFGNRDAGKISFANLNNTGGGDLDTSGATTASPEFPALLKVPAGTGAPVVSGGASVGSTLSCSTGSWAADVLPELLYRAPHSFAYEWKLGGSDVPGATASSITASSPGDYTCQVTAENFAGSTSQTSTSHTVSAAPAPPAQHTLSVRKSGSGSGTVTSSPAGINCGTSCVHAFDSGTMVTLTATPAAGSSFAGWGGACSGTGACHVTMADGHDVSATFVRHATRPNTKLGKTKIHQRKRTANFKFKGTGGATSFQCKLTAQSKKLNRWTRCRSPKTYKHLKRGRHVFYVRAIGPGGTDKSPAKKTFRIS